MLTQDTGFIWQSGGQRADAQQVKPKTASGKRLGKRLQVTNSAFPAGMGTQLKLCLSEGPRPT